MIRAYFGHHKCASQYIKAVFLEATGYLGMRPKRVDNFSALLPLDSHLKEPYMTSIAQHRQRLLTEPVAALCLTNGDNEAVSLLAQRSESYRGFHVIRDPRDILVSAYFSHLYSHPIRDEGRWIAQIRQQLQEADDVEAGLLLEMDFDACIFQQMEKWDYANPCIYETRYETLIANPKQEFEHIFTHLNIPILPIGLPSLCGIAFDSLLRRTTQRPMPPRNALPRFLFKRILDRHSFSHHAEGRQQGEEDVRHHYRKGVAGDWRTYFTPRISAAFKERYGNLLIQLGYETTKDWS